MIIILKPTKKDTILREYNSYFKTMIKAVVDVDKQVIALDAELHADLEVPLLEQGSDQKHLWGINLYLNKKKKDWLEYTAFINIRPSLDNRDMEIKDDEIRNKIKEIVHGLIIE